MHSSEVEEYFAPKSSSIECGAKSGGIMGIKVLKGQKLHARWKQFRELIVFKPGRLGNHHTQLSHENTGLVDVCLFVF